MMLITRCYCFNKETRKWICLEGERRFFHFLKSGYYFDSFDRTRKNIYFENVSMDFCEDAPGKYVFCDEDFKVFDVRVFKKEVKRLWESDFYRGYFRQDYKNNYSYGDIIYHKSGTKIISYAFRKDPVPCLRTYWKKPRNKERYKQIISCIKNPEKKEFIRKKHYQSLIDDAFDYEFMPRTIEKTWKQKKIKHQWEKNIRK